MGAAEGGSIGNNFNLRGFSARTDLYLDGMRDRGQFYRDVFSLDAVEVLQGPSSMLFGRGSTGGVINQVSKVPSLTPFATATVIGGTQPSFRATADFNQPIDDTSAFRVAAMATVRRFDARRHAEPRLRRRAVAALRHRHADRDHARPRCSRTTTTCPTTDCRRSTARPRRSTARTSTAPPTTGRCRTSSTSTERSPTSSRRTSRCATRRTTRTTGSTRGSPARTTSARCRRRASTRRSRRRISSNTTPLPLDAICTSGSAATTA